MKLEITRYSQEINVEDTEDAHYFLVVRDSSGSEHRIPVTADAINQLALIMAKSSEDKKPEPKAPEPEEESLPEQKPLQRKLASIYDIPPDGKQDPDDGIPENDYGDLDYDDMGVPSL